MSVKPGDVNLADPDQLMEVGLPPYDYFAMLRQQAPVHWNPAPPPEVSVGPMPVREGFWVLSKWEDVNMASRDSKRFSSWLGGPLVFDTVEDDRIGSPFTIEAQRMGMMAMDATEHTTYRRLVSSGFTPRSVADMEPMIRRHAGRIIDRIRDQDDAEFVYTVAAELPMMTLCELMGVPEADWEKFFHWGNTAAMGESTHVDSYQNSLELFAYCQHLVESKRSEPDRSMLSHYATKEIEGQRLTDLEINMFFLTLSIAGHETTRNTTAHFVRLISEHPDQREVLLADLPARLPNAIEEVLRYSPPVMQFCRTVTEDVTLRGEHVKAGEKVYLSYVSANRDEEVFNDPDRFDILRENASQHLSFGIGPHFCIGHGLARMQLRTILDELLTARPQVEVSGPPRQYRSIWLNALTELPVAFHAEAVTS